MIKKYKKDGVTIVEILIVGVILGLLSLGVVRVIRDFSDVWWVGETKLDLQKDAREAMYWIAHDFKRAYMSSIGSVVPNSGIERSSDGVNVDEWDTLSVGLIPPVTGFFRRTDNVRSGSYALKGYSPGAIVNDTGIGGQFTFDNTAPGYVLSGWIFNSASGGNMARCERLPGGAFNISTQTWTKPCWIYDFVDLGPQAAGTTFDLRFRVTGVSTTAYFDCISVWPRVITFNTTLAADAFYRYEISESTGTLTARVGRHRLRFDPNSRQLFREWHNGANYIDIGPSPLCKNVDSLKISKDPNRNYIMIELVLSDRAVPSAQPTTYSLETKVYPSIP